MNTAMNTNVSKELQNGIKNENNIKNEPAIGEIDYAILRCVAYGVETIHDITEMLYIRTIIIERHAYRLIKEGFINFGLKLNITLKGNTTIALFEKDNPENRWRPIDEFIMYMIKQQKERKLAYYKAMNLISIISIIILTMLIIYFGLSIFRLA
jgi:hypothetical protein